MEENFWVGMFWATLISAAIFTPLLLILFMSV